MLSLLRMFQPINIVVVMIGDVYRLVMKSKASWRTVFVLRLRLTIEFRSIALVLVLRLSFGMNRSYCIGNKR